ncbi:SPP1 gp7 family putative phage head morphogenesis protein [Rhizobium sp. PP-CC-2G-626]|nr:SPP1 gp7 family putative phage head morphogenesis protein [Rhizobium sp. PP-CC-2G-626]
MTIELKALQPVAAIAAFEKRKPNLIETFSWQDAWQEEHATMFTVAKSAGFDILQDIQTAFEKALKEGQTARQFASELRPTLEQKGWWGRKVAINSVGEAVVAQLGSTRRLQRIFDTNMRVSYAAGHWESFERNRKSRPFLRYVALLDDRTRPAHRARHNIVLPIDDPFWNLWAPPCGWNCRCTLQSLSQRDIDRLLADGEKLTFEAPEDTFRSFVNKRTGEIVRVPDGIDPGWAYNPGRAGYEAKVNQSIAEKIADAPREMATAVVEERMSSSAFERFVQDPQGSMPVMVIPEAPADGVDAGVRVAILPAETMQQQRLRFPELTIEDYRRLPSMGSSPDLVVQVGQSTLFMSRVPDGRWRVAVLEISATRSAALLTSYRYSSADAVARLLQDDAAKILIDRRE